MHTLGTHGIEHRILHTQTDRDLRITRTIKNHPVRDWLDLLGNLVGRRDVFLLKKIYKRSNLIIF